MASTESNAMASTDNNAMASTDNNALTPTESNELYPNMLQNKDHCQLIDTIDLLRAQGVNKYISLPQLIVCGNQSSGKSSVLEALSGVRFPTKDNLCTRFATEIVLRRSQDVSVTVNITPGTNHTDAFNRRLSSFNYPNPSIAKIPDIITKATEEMDVGPNKTRAFSDDVLHVVISGPEQPQLTLIDLPGVIHSANEDKDIALVASLVQKYMKEDRSIILAIVTAKDDYANQIVTKMARDADPEGDRTLGIITKPDTLPPGSDSEKEFFELAKNKKVSFRLGWHVLRNRDWNSSGCSAKERDATERAFFASGTWNRLPSKCKGIDSLRTRLSTVLKDQIVAALPDVNREVRVRIDECNRTLDELGPARGTMEEQRRYLINISQKCGSLLKAAVDGSYDDQFFGGYNSNDGYNKRLRAVIQEHLTRFAEDMVKNGHTYEIIDDEQPYKSNERRSLYRREYILKVQDLKIKNRGRELPGHYNPLIVGDLFYEQAEPWEKIAKLHRSELLETINRCIDLVLEHVTDETTRNGLQRHVFRPAMDLYERELDNKICEILRPHKKGHPMTYSPEFAEELKRLRNAHVRKEKITRLKKYFRCAPDTAPGQLSGQNFHLDELLDALTERTDQEVDLYACSEATDCMLVYYKAALKVFIDNFASLAVETHLLEKIYDIFTPEKVMEMQEIVVEDIAAESEESKNERQSADTQLESLRKGLATLQTMTRNKFSVGNEEAISADNTREQSAQPVTIAVDAPPTEPVEQVTATPNRSPTPNSGSNAQSHTSILSTPSHWNGTESTFKGFGSIASSPGQSAASASPSGQSIFSASPAVSTTPNSHSASPGIAPSASKPNQSLLGSRVKDPEHRVGATETPTRNERRQRPTSNVLRNRVDYYSDEDVY